MFNLAWSEIALIGVVALVAIGPKDLPVALRTVAGMIKKARRMASEFQGHVDEMMKEADLSDLKNQIDEIRNFDIKGEIENAVDPDGSLRETFASNPLEPGGGASTGEAAPAAVLWQRPKPRPPAFVPPEIAEPPPPPAFIPPDAVRH